MSWRQREMENTMDSSVTTQLQRKNENHQRALSAYKVRNLASCLECMTRAQLIEVLQAVGENYIEVHKLVQSEVSKKMDDETRMYRCQMSNVVHFNGCLEAARRAMDDAESRVRFLHSWSDLPDSSNDDFTNMVQLIADHCGAFAHPKTRVNGLTVMCDMCHVLIKLAAEDFHKEARSKYCWDESLENAMLEVITAMTLAERQAVVDDDALWPTLLSVYQQSSNKLFRAFGDIIDEFPKLDSGTECEAEENDGLRYLSVESDQNNRQDEVDMLGAK
ncbi:hypothetical protein BDV26DRAFT_289280 [Aspergillus bertholletiae]|uniref:Uncharacterized protein n=1 Tax=Aspergillus bertholletiae TaxID=1226010 RepID=A0A5N7BIL2_9EURO|nr:hypothetical protein BDV26DRAFT_289280 [Aspergillus bertholletiae]